jgi:acid phosphatase type 7
MQPSRLTILSALLISVFLRAQDEEGKRKGPGPGDLPTSSLISKPGPSFIVSQDEIKKQTKVIVYGDQRFTDPTNTKVTNPKVRRLLVQKIHS